MLRKYKWSCLHIFLLCLLCVARGVQIIPEHHGSSVRLMQKQLIQQNEESENALDMKVAKKGQEEEDLEYDDAEYDEMIKQQLEIQNAQQELKNQWCLSNKHFKESQWFSEALENASKCITWEEIILLGKTKQIFKLFLQKESSQKNEREGNFLNQRNRSSHSEEQIQGEEGCENGKNLEEQQHKYEKKTKQAKTEVDIPDKNKVFSQINRTQQKEEEYLQELERQPSEQYRAQPNATNIIAGNATVDRNNPRKKKEKGSNNQFSKKLQLQKIQQEIREEFLIWQSAEGELIQPNDSFNLSSQSTCIQKWGNNYCSKETCIQMEMKESNIKEDFLRILHCLNEGIIQQTSSNSNSKTPDLIFKYCLIESSSFFPKNQKKLIKKVQFQVDHCSRTQYDSGIFQCLDKIQCEDESRLVQNAFECTKKYASSHDSILPSCQKQFLQHFDAQHEEFQELCDLKCGKLYDKFFAPLVLESAVANYNELRSCIQNIAVENEQLITEAINVISCFKEKQISLQEKWTRN